MPRKREKPMTTCPPAAEMELQIETVLPRSTRGRRQVAGPGPRVGPVAPRLPRITRLMALAIRFQEMVDHGETLDYADLARLGYVTRARMTQIMNLLLLAPDIQERLLFLVPTEPQVGQALVERQLRLIAAIPDWPSQRTRLGQCIGSVQRSN